MYSDWNLGDKHMNNNADRGKINAILILAIIEISLLFLGIIFIASGIVTNIQLVSNDNIEVNTNASEWIGLILSALGFLSLTGVFVLNLATSIMILCTKFTIREIDDSKLIWGLLSLLLLGPIASFIFIALAKQTLKRITPSDPAAGANQTNESKSV